MFLCVFCFFFFFFFQAEDGIRDWSVTGVQTCALPICTDGQLPGIARILLRNFVGYPLSLLLFGLGFLLAAVNPSGRALHDLIAGTVVVRRHGSHVIARSEEHTSELQSLTNLVCSLLLE